MYKMRLGWYAGASTALAGSVVLFAFHQRPNFYSAMVYLAQSNFCLLILVNFILLIYSTFLYGMTRLCFGRLRAVEVEQLTERAWFAITETCLAMTIFREEIGPWFLVMFTALVSGKIWGWIGDGRVEVLEQQPPANPHLFHLRLSVSLAVSFLYDIWLLHYAIGTVIQQARPNMMVMFLFEFAVLSTCSWRTGIRYLFSVAEQRIIKTQTQNRLLERRREVREQREEMTRQRESAAASGQAPDPNEEPLPHEDDIDEMDIEVPGWSAKGEWVLWLDLITDMIKLGIYIAFFMMILMFYGLPIHIIRDLFMTSRDFLKRLSALLRYRRAIQEMNRYPDATEEELAQENTCIICREEMRPWDPANNPGAVDRVRPKKLPCGHTLHLGCLKSWLERQQVCPTCRSPVSMDNARPGNARVGLRIQIGGVEQPQQQGAQQPQAQPPAANAPGQGPQNQPNAAPPGGQGQQQPQPQPANRPRIFNLGPLRLGFGANGAQLRDLAQQFGRPQPQAVVNAGNAAATPTATTTTTSQIPLTGNNIQDAANLLHQAEQALQREVQSLENRQQALQTSQLLLAELQNLRQTQQVVDTSPSGATQQNIVSPNIQPPGSARQQNFTTTLSPGPQQQPQQQGERTQPIGFAGLPARMNSPLLGRHGTSGYATEIPSGSPDLPEGVVIPPGWSLMPLQRLNGYQAPQQQQPTQQPTQQPPPSAPIPNQQNQSHQIFTSLGGDPNTPPVATNLFGTQTANIRPPEATRNAQSTEHTPMFGSPNPDVPTWGAQPRLFENPALANPNTSLDGAAREESREGRSRVPQIAEPSSSADQNQTQARSEGSADGSSSIASSSSAPSSSSSQQQGESGKAQAVTLEEASDEEEED